MGGVKRTMHSKSVSFAILLSFMLPAALPAATAIDPQSEYAKAVKSYVDAATEHLKAVQSNVEAQLKNATDETKDRFKKTNEAIERTGKLLSQLKDAAPADFDRIKLEFERSRDQMVKEFEVAQKG